MADMNDYDYLRVLFALAWADQKIQHEEKSFLDEIIPQFDKIQILRYNISYNNEWREKWRTD